MKVFITSKGIFDSLMDINGITNENVEANDKTFFISINDSCGTPEVPFFKKDYKNVKVVFFDDIEEDVQHPQYGLIKAFSKEQAVQLVEFISSHADKDKCIVHCSAGISRSGAVGTFVNHYFKGDYYEFKKLNPHIHPNGLVLRLLKAAAFERPD